MKIRFQATAWPDAQRTVREGTVSPVPDTKNQENQLLNLYPQFTDQIWEGFAGAFTDSAAYVYSLMSAQQRETLLHSYFDPDKLNYQFIRVPIDSCDFSLSQYEAAPGGDLSRFSMERAEAYILPMLRDAEKIAGRKLPLLLSPWSPPALFKTNGERAHGGKCKREYWGLWAEYLCRYIEEYRARGFLVRAMTLQNEPNAVQVWDSCLWNAQEEHDFLVEYMKPALIRHGLREIGVFFWDHNKERILERAVAMFDEKGLSCASGAAFHWYSGDHFEALAQVHRLYPDKKLILSENCLEYRFCDVSNPAANAQRVAHEIIGNLKSGMNAFFDWNVLLDENGGPNYAGNFCHAPYMFHTKEGQLVRTSLYDALGCFASAIQPGAVRILCSCYTGKLETVAFRNPDGTIGTVILNTAEDDLPLILRLDGCLGEITVPAHGIASAVIEK